MAKLTSKELLEKETEGKTASLFPFILFLKLYTRNWPDRLVLLPGGRCFFIEFKAEDDDLRQGQELAKGRLEEQGFAVYVVDRVSLGIQIIKRELLIQSMEL